jgi:predicted amidohydrolase
MRVAAYQMPVSACYGDKSIAHVAARVRQCEDDRVSLLCCPEGALGGLADYVDTPANIALSSDPEELTATLQPLASRNVVLIIGFTERDWSGRYYNAAAVYSDGVVVGIYRKYHPAIRRSRYSAGTELPVFQINGAVVGILICRDSTDVRLASALVEQGAELLCIPTNNAMPPARGGLHLNAEVRALDARLAQHLRVPIVRADVVGVTRGLVSAGASTITQPSTMQLRATGTEQGEIVAADLSLGDKTGERTGIAIPAV